MSVFYKKYQNKTEQSVSFGKWFARAVTLGKTVDVKALAKHMSEHNTPYSEGVIRGVLTDMVNCIRELVLDGRSVKLENLAIFSAGIQTKKGGARTSEEFSTSKHIISVYLRARATGNFTRDELTKAGNVTELPKNFTDYKEEEEEENTGTGGENTGENTGTGGQTTGGQTEGNDGPPPEGGGFGG